MHGCRKYVEGKEEEEEEEEEEGEEFDNEIAVSLSISLRRCKPINLKPVSPHKCLINPFNIDMTPLNQPVWVPQLSKLINAICGGRG